MHGGEGGEELKEGEGHEGADAEHPEHLDARGLVLLVQMGSRGRWVAVVGG